MPLFLRCYLSLVLWIARAGGQNCHCSTWSSARHTVTVICSPSYYQVLQHPINHHRQPGTKITKLISTIHYNLAQEGVFYPMKWFYRIKNLFQMLPWGQSSEDPAVMSFVCFLFLVLALFFVCLVLVLAFCAFSSLGSLCLKKHLSGLCLVFLCF